MNPPFAVHAEHPAVATDAFVLSVVLPKTILPIMGINLTLSGGWTAPCIAGPAVNPTTAAKVLKIAEALGEPNVAGRLLKLNRKLIMSVHLPKEIVAFFDLLGIQS